MEDLGCAVVSQGIVVIREWKIKDAQWNVCDWTISMCLAQLDKALQTISKLCLHITAGNMIYVYIRSTCRLDYRKLLVRAFPFKT